MGEEAVDGGHDLGWTGPKKLAQAVLCVPLSFFFVFKHSHLTVRFVHPANANL